jgi:hypothetical protein
MIYGDSMFPEVFGSSGADHLQLASFYGSRCKVSNPEQPPALPVMHQHQLDLLLVMPSAMDCPGAKPGLRPVPITSNGGPACMRASTRTTDLSEKVVCRTVMHIPPLRRVVKLSLQPSTTARVVGALAAINVLMCIGAVTPGVFWGTFLYLWAVVTLCQTVICSVYVCTHVDGFFSILHLGVATVANLIPRDMFASWGLIAPVLCIWFVSHQCHMFWLVFAHISNRKAWIFGIVVGTILPLTQLLRTDRGVSSDMSTQDIMFSSVSIAFLYGTALGICIGSVVVDISIGTSPLWVAGEAD